MILKKFASSFKLFNFWKDWKTLRSCSQVVSAIEVNSQENDNQIQEHKIYENVYSLLGDGFNYSKAKHFNLKKKKAAVKIDKKQDETNITQIPIALKHLMKNNEELSNQFEHLMIEQSEEMQIKTEVVSYPYSHHQKLSTEEINDANLEDSNKENNILVQRDYITNYLKFLDSDLTDIESYNEAQPDVPLSEIPCSGCGAILHCQDKSIPGFIPSKKFLSKTTDELRKEICFRCFFLKYYHTAMNIHISPEEYPKAISEISKRRALVLLMVDLIDFPCSIWPGIIDLVGEDRPICVVGNKVDLLPCDHKNYLDIVKKSLAQSLKDYGVDKGSNIKHIELISAKTGFGIERLITKLQNSWQYKGDIYLVGCTNVGKSSLFNALIQSDLCKKQATDLIPPTTTSVWPGTTVNLLKFPIFRMTEQEKYMRTERLVNQSLENVSELEYKRNSYNKTKDARHATLFGHVKRTFSLAKESRQYNDNHFSAGRSSTNGKTYDPNDIEYKYGRFFYDTPGSVFREQILDLLTTEELLKILPKEIIIPRTFLVRQNQTLFVAGVGKIDIEKADYSAYATVFASSLLPVHIVHTEDADQFYKQYIGTDMLMVPHGGEKRIKQFPPLEGKTFLLNGRNWRESCADIVLSSAGWVSFTAGDKSEVKLTAFTPKGRGIHLRQPSLLPLAVNLRGRRIKGVPAYENQLVSIKWT